MAKGISHRADGKGGQAVVEMTFSMIIAVILSLAVVRFFLWTFEDINTRKLTHRQVLHNVGGRNGCGGAVSCPAQAVRPKFFEYVPPQAEIAK